MSRASGGGSMRQWGPLVFLGFGKATGALALWDLSQEGGLRVPGWSDLRPGVLFGAAAEPPWEQC